MPLDAAVRIVVTFVGVVSDVSAVLGTVPAPMARTVPKKIGAAGYGATGGVYSFGVVVTSADGQVVTSTQSVTVNADATFSPTNKSTDIILSGGNLVAERGIYGGYASVRATGKMFAANKTQCEFVITHVGPSPFVIVGIGDGTADISGIFQIASDVHGYGYYQDTGEKIHSNSLSAYGASFKTDGDVITMLYDGLNKEYQPHYDVWQIHQAAGELVKLDAFDYPYFLKGK